jgi:hypothetical protein
MAEWIFGNRFPAGEVVSLFFSQYSYYLWSPRDLLFIGYRGFFARDKKTVK